MIDVIELPGETHTGRDNVLEVTGVDDEHIQTLASLVTMSQVGEAFQITIGELDDQETDVLSKFVEQLPAVLWSLQDIDRLTIYRSGEMF